MKRLFLAGLFLACSMASSGANIPVDDTSTRVHQTVPPEFPRSLLASGVTSGWCRVVVDIDESGAVSDWLVVGHTAPEFGESAVTAIRQWEFFPMIRNGRPVGSQVLIGFDYAAKGVVINISAETDITRLMRGDSVARVYRPLSPREIDRIPLPLHWVEPVYPKELEQRGVTGSATVEFYIDETGAVRMPAVVRADFPELGSLLSDAIRQWTFEPPTRRGRPVLVQASQTVTFGQPDK